jgi:hypothetical protein
VCRSEATARAERTIVRPVVRERPGDASRRVVTGQVETVLMEPIRLARAEGTLGRIGTLTTATRPLQRVDSRLRFGSNSCR